VIPQKTLNYVPNLLKLKPDYVVHGDDWKAGVQKEVRQQVIDKARQLILKCVCAQGCPACIGPMSTEPKPYSAKQAAFKVLDNIAEAYAC